MASLMIYKTVLRPTYRTALTKRALQHPKRFMSLDSTTNGPTTTPPSGSTEKPSISDVFAEIENDDILDEPTPRYYNPDTIPTPMDLPPRYRGVHSPKNPPTHFQSSTGEVGEDEEPVREIREYRICVHSTRNNVIMTFAKDGYTFKTIGSGHLGYKKSKRNSYEAAYSVSLAILNLASEEVKRFIPTDELLTIRNAAERQGFFNVLKPEEETRIKQRLAAEDRAASARSGEKSRYDLSDDPTNTMLRLGHVRANPKFQWEGDSAEARDRPEIRFEIVLNGFGQGRDAFLQALGTREGLFVKKYTRWITDGSKIWMGGHRPQVERRI